MSRKASSSASGSTSGVMALNTAMTSRETVEYWPCRGGMITAWGQSRAARAIGMAECTPKARAS